MNTTAIVAPGGADQGGAGFLPGIGGSHCQASTSPRSRAGDRVRGVRRCPRRRRRRRGEGAHGV